MKPMRAILLLALTAGLSACGGGGGGSSASAPDGFSNSVPSTAVVNAAAYKDFVGSLKKSDTDQPIDVNGVWTPPLTETESPSPI